MLLLLFFLILLLLYLYPVKAWSDLPYHSFPRHETCVFFPTCEWNIFYVDYRFCAQLLFSQSFCLWYPIFSDFWIATHFVFKYLHGTWLKLKLGIHSFIYMYIYIVCVVWKKKSIYAQPWIIMCLTAELAVSLEALIVALYEWNTYFTPIFQFSLWHYIVRCVPRLLNSPLHRRIWMGIWVTKSIASYAKHWLTMSFSI